MKEPTANDYRDAATHVRKSGRGCVRCQDAADLLDRAADAMQPADDLAVGVPPLLPVGTLITNEDGDGIVVAIVDDHGPYIYRTRLTGGGENYYKQSEATPYIPRYVGKGTTYGETTGEWRVHGDKLEVEVKVNSITDHSIYGQCAYWPLADCRWLADDALEAQDE